MLFYKNSNKVNDKNEEKYPYVRYSYIIHKLVYILSTMIFNFIDADKFIPVDKIFLILKLILVLIDDEKFGLDSEISNPIIIDFEEWKNKLIIKEYAPTTLIFFVMSFFSLRSKYPYSSRNLMFKNLEIKKKNENGNNNFEVSIKKKKDEIEYKNEDFIKLYFLDFQHLKITNFLNGNLIDLEQTIKNFDKHYDKDKNIKLLRDSIKYVNYQVEQINFMRIKCIMKDTIDNWLYAIENNI